MKVFIWFLCLFINAFITTLFKESGNSLGAFPTMALYGVMIWLASFLCKKWDKYKAKKEEEQDRTEFVESIKVEETSGDSMTSNDAMKVFIEMQAQEVVHTMDANSVNQVGSEDSDDFGLVPENPIYTSALRSVDGEKEYLNKLCTVSGEKIQWNRRGSTSVDGVNGMIDIYDTYLSSGQLYKTIYINMYGAKASTKVPTGFDLLQVGSMQNTVSEKKTKSESNKKSIGLRVVIAIIICAIVYGAGFLCGNLFQQNDTERWKSNYAILEDKNEDLVREYNSLVDDFNILLEEYWALSDKKAEYDAFETLYFSGSGNDIIKGINAPEGTYYITTTHNGQHNCFANFYADVDSYGPLAANFVGKGSEVYGFTGAIKNGYINISADGDWTVTIEKAD